MPPKYAASGLSPHHLLHELRHATIGEGLAPGLRVHLHLHHHAHGGSLTASGSDDTTPLWRPDASKATGARGPALRRFCEAP